MKLSYLFLLLSIGFLGQTAPALAASDAGLRYIKTRGTVRCGTDLQSKFYAYKDEDGLWRGIDVDLCKAISWAVFNRPDRFQMVDIKKDAINHALQKNKIDVMFGVDSFSALQEITQKNMTIDITYYERQMFAAHKIDGATSMEAYKGAKVCTVRGSEDFQNVNTYSRLYKLDFTPLVFHSSYRAKEAFLLNRCQLLTGNTSFLQDVVENKSSQSKDVVLLPESIAIKPVYALVSKDNNTLRISLKWIFNALKSAESNEINSQNVKVFIGSKDIAVQNLLGDNPHLWNKFGLSPNWVRNAIADIGNYGEIYERNFGKDSPLGLKRRENNLIKNHGLIIPKPFL